MGYLIILHFVFSATISLRNDIYTIKRQILRQLMTGSFSIVF